MGGLNRDERGGSRQQQHGMGVGGWVGVRVGCTSPTSACYFWNAETRARAAVGPAHFGVRSAAAIFVSRSCTIFLFGWCQDKPLTHLGVLDEGVALAAQHDAARHHRHHLARLAQHLEAGRRGLVRRSEAGKGNIFFFVCCVAGGCGHPGGWVGTAAAGVCAAQQGRENCLWSTGEWVRGRRAMEPALPTRWQVFWSSLP